MDENEQPTAIDSFHRHEVLHVAEIIAQLFDERITEHRYTLSEPVLAQAAEDLSQRLFDFYQLVGRTELAE